MKFFTIYPDYFDLLFLYTKDDLCGGTFHIREITGPNMEPLFISEGKWRDSKYQFNIKVPRQYKKIWIMG